MTILEKAAFYQIIDLLAVFVPTILGSVCVYFNSFLFPGEQPTLIELIRFRGRERRINIPQQIGANFMKFGVLLLEDTNGARMQSITHECRDSPEQINTKVLQEWITGRGRLPVSWDTLIEVLHDVDLGTLADDIAAVKCS